VVRFFAFDTGVVASEKIPASIDVDNIGKILREAIILCSYPKSRVVHFRGLSDA
jgi:hypothetical protein